MGKLIIKEKCFINYLSFCSRVGFKPSASIEMQSTMGNRLIVLCVECSSVARSEKIYLFLSPRCRQPRRRFSEFHRLFSKLNYRGRSSIVKSIGRNGTTGRELNEIELI